MGSIRSQTPPAPGFRGRPPVVSVGRPERPVDSNMAGGTDTAVQYDFPDAAVARMPAKMVRNAEPDICPAALFYHLLSLFHTRCHGLLDQDMFSCPGRRYGLGCVETVRGRDDHRIEGRIGQHTVDVRVGRHRCRSAVSVTEILRSFAIPTYDAPELYAIDRRKRRCMLVARDSARSYDSNILGL